MYPPSVDKLIFTYGSQGNRISDIEDSVCDYKATLEVDASDMSVHQLFGVFAKVLASMGFMESVIMNGACNLAFNDMRSHEAMVELIEKYELNDIWERMVEEQRKHKELDESADHSKKSDTEDESN